MQSCIIILLEMLGLARFLHYNNTEINNLFLLPLKCCGFTREESSMFSKAARQQNMQTGNFLYSYYTLWQNFPMVGKRVVALSIWMLGIL